MPIQIFPHQQQAFDELLRCAHIFFEGNWQKLPVRPRFNTLITGSTGTGKSQLIWALARSLQKPLLQVDTANWHILGASRSGCQYTWQTVLDFVEENADGGIIFLDEICKVGGGRSMHMEGSWDRHLKVEVFGLLDGRIPPGVTPDSCDDWDEATFDRSTTQEALRNKIFLLAAGAFQETWDVVPKPPVGFRDSEMSNKPTHDYLNYIPRELLNRFRGNILTLTMEPEDYHRIKEDIASKLPKHLKKIFIEICDKSLPTAIAQKQGVRFVEECLLETLLEQPISTQKQLGFKANFK